VVDFDPNSIIAAPGSEPTLPCFATSRILSVQCLQHAGGSCSPSATHVLLRGVVGHLLVRVGTAHRTGGEAWPPVTFADDCAPAPCGHNFGAQAALSAACHQFANRINLCAGDDVERSGWHHRRYAVPFLGPSSLPLRHRLEQ